ncbi:MAG: tyrosine-type recombinase/integrase [Candidatus Limnocylindrales bacterium]
MGAAPQRARPPRAARLPRGGAPGPGRRPRPPRDGGPGVCLPRRPPAPRRARPAARRPAHRERAVSAADPALAGGRGGFGWHRLRHGLGTAMGEHGASMAEIAARLNHKSVRSTARYVHPSPAHVAALVEQSAWAALDAALAQGPGGVPDREPQAADGASVVTGTGRVLRVLPGRARTAASQHLDGRAGPGGRSCPRASPDWAGLGHARDPPRYRMRARAAMAIADSRVGPSMPPTLCPALRPIPGPPCHPGRGHRPRRGRRRTAPACLPSPLASRDGRRWPRMDLGLHTLGRSGLPRRWVRVRDGQRAVHGAGEATARALAR